MKVPWPRGFKEAKWVTWLLWVLGILTLVAKEFDWNWMLGDLTEDKFATLCASMLLVAAVVLEGVLELAKGIVVEVRKNNFYTKIVSDEVVRKVNENKG